MRLITESIHTNLTEGTFGEEVGFAYDIEISELEDMFSEELCKIFGIPEDKGSWFSYGKFELHRGTSWTDSNPWMRVEVQNIDDIAEAVFKKSPDKYPTMNKLDSTGDLVSYSSEINIGGSGQGFYNVDTYLDMFAHHLVYEDMTDEEIKELDEKMSKEEKELAEEIDKTVKDNYNQLLQVMLDYEYIDEDEEDMEEE